MYKGTKNEQQKMCQETKNVQESKKFAQGTKNVPLSQNEVPKDPMSAKCYLLWHIMVLNCLVWSFMAEYRLFSSQSQIQIHLVLFKAQKLAKTALDYEGCLKESCPLDDLPKIATVILPEWINKL